MFAAYGIAMALLARERTRHRDRRSISRCSTRPSRCSPIRPATTSRAARVPARLGNRHPSIVPYETFTASDGDFVLAVGNDEQWRPVLRASPALPADERFATNRQRVSGYDALRPFVADRLRQQPRQYWIDALTAAGVPCGSVRNFDELFADPQLDAREMIAMVEHATIGPLKALGVPVKLSETPGRGAHAAAHPRPAHRRGAARTILDSAPTPSPRLRQQKVI